VQMRSKVCGPATRVSGRTAALILLLFAGPTVSHAVDAAWPSKGDTVYVSATLVHFIQAIPGISGSHRETNVPACVPLTIKKAKPDDSQWTTRDPVGGEERLDGPWLPRMHRTEPDCKAYLAAAGEPTVVRSGPVHKIVPSEAGETGRK
jgi:hypothetical protein